MNSEPFKKSFYADKWSCGTLFCVTMLAGLILIPIFVGLATGNFWLSQLEATETPNVRFRNEVILVTYEAGATYGYSTNQNLQASFANKVRGLSIQATPIDSNKDRLPDLYHFDISFQVTSTQLTGAQLYLFFDYGLNETVRLQMQDYIKVSIFSQTSIRKANVQGTLALFQEAPIQSSKITRSVYNTSFFSDSIQNLDLMALDALQAQRNESLYCTGCVPTVFSETTSGGFAEIVVDITIPIQQTVWYIPTLFYNIKFAWVQFIFLFIPLYFVVCQIRSFAFDNKIFDHYETRDLPYKTK